MENLSPKIWVMVDPDRESKDRRLLHFDCEREADTPRAGDVLARIGLALLAHGAVVVLVIWMLHAFGVH